MVDKAGKIKVVVDRGAGNERIVDEGGLVHGDGMIVVGGGLGHFVFAWK